MIIVADTGRCIILRHTITCARTFKIRLLVLVPGYLRYCFARIPSDSMGTI